MEVRSKSTNPGSERSLFPDLAPYGAVRPMPAQPKEPEAEESKVAPKAAGSAYDGRFQLSDRFSKSGAAAIEYIDPGPADGSAPVLESKNTPKPSTEIHAPALKKRRLLPTLIIALIVVFGGLGTGGYLLLHSKQPPSTTKRAAPATAARQVITIPVYIPASLPAGYTYNNDKKTVSPNVYSMSVTGPHKEFFYITEQMPPVNNDYTPFDKQLTDPRSYDAPLGKVTTGSTKSSFIVSIGTVKNTWVIINSPNTGSQSIIKPVIDSLSL